MRNPLCRLNGNNRIANAYIRGGRILGRAKRHPSDAERQIRPNGSFALTGNRAGTGPAPTLADFNRTPRNITTCAGEKKGRNDYRQGCTPATMRGRLNPDEVTERSVAPSGLMLLSAFTGVLAPLHYASVSYRRRASPLPVFLQPFGLQPHRSKYYYLLINNFMKTNRF